MIRTLIAALLGATIGASGAVAEPRAEMFGDWQLRVMANSAAKQWAYLAYEPAPGASLEIYCNEPGYQIFVGVTAPESDRSPPTLPVTYTVGSSGGPVSEDWRRLMMHMTYDTPSDGAVKHQAGALVAQMRRASGRFEIELLGQRLAPSLERFDGAMAALEPYCGNGR